jgi:hypothetical protein
MVRFGLGLGLTGRGLSGIPRLSSLKDKAIKLRNQGRMLCRAKPGASKNTMPINMATTVTN